MPAKKSSAGSAGTNGKGGHPTDAIKFLHQHNDDIKSKAAKLGSGFEASAENAKALRDLIEKWSVQSSLKNRVVYPAFADAGVSEESIAEAQIENDLVAALLRDLVFRDINDPMFKAVVKATNRAVQRLCQVEEDDTKGLFKEAKKVGVDLERLGTMLQQTHQRAEDEVTIPSPRHLRGVGTSASMENNPMRVRERERDERGRFVEDDDRRGRRSYDDVDRSSMRGRDDDDDARGWYGDRRAHAMAARRGWETRRGEPHDDDDRRGYRGRSDYDDDRRMSRGRDYDDDRRMSRGRGTGGWFGDQEGHSEASRRGWDNPDHGPSGWYGDSERHARASRRGWDSPDHGPSGWYGDSEGHSRAARRGWDNPDHGESGWYGDSEGHSEASRRGWDDRRSRHEDDYDHRRMRRRSDY
jgi:hypothetical protein